MKLQIKKGIYVHPNYNLSDVTVIIPAYNEELGIRKTLLDLKAKCPDIHVIVVDDGSSDDTSNQVATVDGINVIRHDLNRGYGAALKTGMRAANTPIVAWYDSDGQHMPEDLLNVLQPVLANKLDASLGKREKGSAFVVKRVPGKILLKLISQFIARRRIPDLNCGLRAFRKDIISKYLHLLPNGFSASATSTLLMIKRGYHVGFTKIKAQERIGHSTVKFRDGFRTIALLLRILVLFDSFLFFSFFACLQIIPGLIYSYKLAVMQGQGVPVLGAVAVISGIIVFGLGIISSQINTIRLEKLE
jgi:glycosyltransferase involved in cell wall biosynthesis